MRADAAIAACPDYEPETCRTALQQVLAPFGGLAWVKPGMRIAVKANLVSAMKPERAATTHPMLLRGPDGGARPARRVRRRGR